ncbi:hypothetical protein MB2181_04310 [Methylophilales bacterium HTCC2181]|uniref:Uncharacterized protein n=1 Tax=Methylophilales bacterium HTCC2181 TaxID=383631 RepID=A0P6V9_9PROT|nr:hypothetical protein MB2181_04310 [Methylophilales bacterium HTCC2181]
MKNITSIAFLLLFGFFLNTANATSIQGPIIDESTFKKYDSINLNGAAVFQGEFEVNKDGLIKPFKPSSIEDYKMLRKAASTNPKVTPVILEQSKLLAVRDTCAYLAARNLNIVFSLKKDFSNITVFEPLIPLLGDELQDQFFSEIFDLFTNSEITFMNKMVGAIVEKLRLIIDDNTQGNNLTKLTLLDVKTQLAEIINVTNNTVGFIKPPITANTSNTITANTSNTITANISNKTYIDPSNICVSNNMNLSHQNNLTLLNGYSGSPVKPYEINPWP